MAKTDENRMKDTLGWLADFEAGFPVEDDIFNNDRLSPEGTQHIIDLADEKDEIEWLVKHIKADG